MNTSTTGFTLLEMLMVGAIMTILAGGVTALSRDTLQRRALEEAVAISVVAGQRAALFAQGGKYDGAWGIRFFPDRAVVFQGASYAARTVQYDETHPHDTVDISGTTEILFPKISAFPAAATTTTYSIGALQKTFSVNEYAVFSY